MKWTRYSWVALLAAAVMGQTANAEPNPGAHSYYQGNSSFASARLDDGEAAPAPTAAPSGDCTTCNSGCDTCCDSGCGCGGWDLFPCNCHVADLGDPHSIADLCFFKERNWIAGGYVAQSYVWNPYQPPDNFNGPLTWTDRANEYQMNEVYGYIGKVANTEGCGFDWGYRADALYGTNYRWDTAAGLESHINNGNFYGLALPQFYAELAYNDLSVKVGHFISPVGYYTVGQGNNFFPILPYTYQYGEPFTHTGVLATYKQSDNFSWGGGFTRGWDNFDNSGNPNLSAIGTANYTGDNGGSLAWVGMYGREPNFSGSGFSPTIGSGFSTRYFQTLVYTKKFSDDVMGVLQSDFGVQGDATATGRTARWYGVNSYLYWNQTCRMQWGLGGEWFRDEEGFRVGQVLPSFGSPNARGNTVGPGFAGNFYRITFGPKYYITPNLYTRAALAADWYDGPRNAGGQLPYDGGTREHQQVGIFDLVWTF
jgi:hypothetical protein